MRQQILYIWVITCISVSGTAAFNLTETLKPTINILEMIMSAFFNNSIENQLQNDTASLQFLQRNIVDELHSPSFICRSPYEVACDWYWIESHRPSERKLVFGPLEHQLLLLKKQVLDLLAKPVLKTDSNSLIVEKQLYQDCLKQRDKPNILKSQSIIDYALSDIIANASHKPWQKLDEELGSMGFGYAFFDITLADNYMTKDKVLLLQPPSSIELVDSLESLSKVMDALKLHSNHKKEFQLAMQFFATLNKGNPDKSTVTVMSVTDLYHYLKENGGQGTQLSEIYWREIFNSVAQHYNIHNTSYIIFVKNIEYFQELGRLLQIYSKAENHIAPFVAIKWLINNLNFANWNAYSYLHSQDKNYICMQQIKLYGASQVVLQSLEENTDIKYLLDTATTILRHIVKTIDIDIFTSKNLNGSGKSMLRSYLDDITASVLHSRPYSSVVDNFYGDFKVTYNYVKDFIGYRKNVDTAERRFVDSYRSPEKLPFNINDLSRAQNRILLRAYLRMHLLVSPYLHKEYHYGVYGTEMSRFIYDLIVRKKLGFKDVYENDEKYLISTIQYPHERKSCLFNKVPDNEVDTVISEVIALKTAYESMKRNYLHDMQIRRPFVFYPARVYSEDAIFILSYLKNHCFWTAKLASHILNNFEPSSSAFGCDFGSPQCNISIF